MAVEARWFIIHTYSGYENKVAENIGKIVENRKMHDKILGVCIPVEKVVEVRDDKTVEVERKIFPSYVVVKLAVEYSDKEGEENVLKVPDETWHAIRYTSGVTGFVGPQGRPLPLTEEEVRKMRLEPTVVDIKVEAGNKVKLSGGALDGFVGTVLSVEADAQKCKVEVEMFGRPTPVDVDLAQIEIID